MNNFGNLSRSHILTELAGGIAELGEAFALILNNMVVQSGITNPKGEKYEVVQKSWKNIAKKADKSDDEIKKLDNDIREEVYTLAKSYLLYIAKNVGNNTGKINYNQYEMYLMKFRFGHYDVMNRPDYINKVKSQIRNAFKKISAHGETQGDNLIDKDDMAALIYAFMLKSKRENDKFAGFEINGDIEPENYAISEHFLFEDSDENMITLKLRVAYKFLKNG